MALRSPWARLGCAGPPLCPRRGGVVSAMIDSYMMKTMNAILQALLTLGVLGTAEGKCHHYMIPANGLRLVATDKKKQTRHSTGSITPARLVTLAPQYFIRFVQYYMDM